MKKLDVVTTALRRSDLLFLTYSSFFNQISDLPKLRIILNVDPIGTSSDKEIIDVVRLFTDDFEIRFADEGSFVEAVKWSFSMVKSDFYLHLEDDWFLNQQMSYKSLVAQLNEKKLEQLVFPMKQQRPNDFGFSFRPHLARKSYADKSSELDDKGNPEKQYIKLANKYGWRTEELEVPYLVTDMGRKWSKSRGLEKSNSSDCSNSGSWLMKRAWFDRFLGVVEFKLLKFFWCAKLFMKCKKWSCL